MAKSMRSKRKKRLRSLRREIAEPFHEKKEAAKLAAQQAALDAPKLPVRVRKDDPHSDLPAEPSTAMDVEMAGGVTSHGDDSKSVLKPVGGIGKKLKKKLLLKKLKRRGKGKGKGKGKSWPRRSRKV